MITYEIHKPLLMLHAKNGVPFMSFDQFNNIVKMYRDDFYAPQYVDGFLADIGVKYNVWTVDLHNRYHRHLFFSEITKPISITFEVPDVAKKMSIPLRISIHDEDGVYFVQNQRIAVELRKGNSYAMAPWRAVPGIKSFIENEYEKDFGFADVAA